MQTTGYKTSRACLQLFSVLIILTSIIAISMSLYNYYLIEIERIIMQGIFITYYGLGMYFLSINIVFALFASCGITSQRKSLMSFYAKVCRLYIATNIVLTLYLTSFYIATFATYLSNEAGHPGVISELILLRTGVQILSAALIRVKNEMYNVLRIFGLAQAVVIGLQIAQLFIILTQFLYHSKKTIISKHLLC